MKTKIDVVEVPGSNRERQPYVPSTATSAHPAQITPRRFPGGD